MAEITIALSDCEKITLTVEKAKELQTQLNVIFPVSQKHIGLNNPHSPYLLNDCIKISAYPIVTS